MKKIVILLVAFLLSCGGQEALHTEIYKGKEILVGKTTRKSFYQKYYNEWFDANYRDYRSQAVTIQKLKPLINSYDIVIVMGTWCGDSREQVPVLYKILDEAGYQKEPEVYCVPRKYLSYKPVKNFHLKRVPTIIIYKNGQEKGRIIEYPMQSLEDDMLKIIQGGYRHELQ